MKKRELNTDNFQWIMCLSIIFLSARNPNKFLNTHKNDVFQDIFNDSDKDYQFYDGYLAATRYLLYENIYKLELLQILLTALASIGDCILHSK